MSKPKRKTTAPKAVNPSKNKPMMAYLPDDEDRRVRAVAKKYSVGITTVMRMIVSAGLPAIERSFERIHEDAKAAAETAAGA